MCDRHIIVAFWLKSKRFAFNFWFEDWKILLSLGEKKMCEAIFQLFFCIRRSFPHLQFYTFLLVFLLPLSRMFEEMKPSKKKKMRKNEKPHINFQFISLPSKHEFLVEKCSLSLDEIFRAEKFLQLATCGKLCVSFSWGYLRRLRKLSIIFNYSLKFH